MKKTKQIKKKKTVTTLTLEQLQERLEKCNIQNLDFITLKPLSDTTTSVYHAELKEEVLINTKWLFGAEFGFD